ncbi:hypothetical protein D9756_010448 [Leucocoprinus leucothites]|uniref:WD40 repeat-like protein n=1 Tax=Leucocoprinus leucothites TaxID=201217 RepID=A0A8H5CUI5_9AGAR|nr:hypothetical protein D9756_010448 [Leucoagaricus leucothites]
MKSIQEMSEAPQFYLLRTLSGHTKPINTLKLSADGIRLMSRGNDCKLIIWNLQAKESLLDLECGGSLSPFIIFGCADGSIHVYRRENERDYAFVTKILAHTSAVQDLAFNPTHNRLASVGDSRLIVWSLSLHGTLTQIVATSPRDSVARSVCFLESGVSVLVSFLQSHEVLIYDLDPWKMRGYYVLPTRIGYAAIGCMGRTLLVSNLTTGIDVYDLPPTKPIRMFRHVIRKNVPLLMTSALGDAVAIAGSDDGTIRVFDQRTGSLMTTLHHAAIGTLVQVVDAVLVKETECMLASATSDERAAGFEIKIWSTENPDDQASAKAAFVLAHCFISYLKQSWMHILGSFVILFVQHALLRYYNYPPSHFSSGLSIRLAPLSRTRLIDMPETLVASFNKDNRKYAQKKGQTNGLPPGHVDEHGYFIVHPECCARTMGNRQTVTLHPCEPSDPVFQRLPTPKGGKKNTACSTCTTQPTPYVDSCAKLDEAILESHTHLRGKSAVEIMNGLHIRGRLYGISRGKELVIGIDCYIIRICFGLEGHSLWIPTSVYKEITSASPVKRGTKSWVFKIPPSHWSGPPDLSSLVSIQAAFVRPDWTLIFCDHNVMITFHVMAIRRSIDSSDFEPDSPLWPYLWSNSHGPVSYLEAEASVFEENLGAWRERRRYINPADNTPIFLEIKDNQLVFNGYGAQETTDMLVEAFLHPLTPTRYGRVGLINEKNSCLPSTSGSKPFRWNDDGHRLFLLGVSTFRRANIRVSKSYRDTVQQFGLDNPDATIMPNGLAKVIPRPSIYRSGWLPRVPDVVRKACNRVTLPIYEISFPSTAGGTKAVRSYTPFITQPGLDWWEVLNFLKVEVDVKDDINRSTIGPYSFDVFVQARWTAKKVPQMPHGRRRVETVNHGVIKRPLAAQVQATSNRPVKKLRLSLLAQTTGTEEENKESETQVNNTPETNQRSTQRERKMTRRKSYS